MDWFHCEISVPNQNLNSPSNFLIEQARLAQSVEHETLNLGVVGSSPTLGDCFEAGASLKNGIDQPKKAQQQLL